MESSSNNPNSVNREQAYKFIQKTFVSDLPIHALSDSKQIQSMAHNLNSTERKALQEILKLLSSSDPAASIDLKGVSLKQLENKFNLPREAALTTIDKFVLVIARNVFGELNSKKLAEQIINTSMKPGLTVGGAQQEKIQKFEDEQKAEAKKAEVAKMKALEASKLEQQQAGWKAQLAKENPQMNNILKFDTPAAPRRGVSLEQKISKNPEMRSLINNIKANMNPKTEAEFKQCQANLKALNLEQKASFIQSLNQNCNFNANSPLGEDVKNLYEYRDAFDQGNDPLQSEGDFKFNKSLFMEFFKESKALLNLRVAADFGEIQNKFPTEKREIKGEDQVVLITDGTPFAGKIGALRKKAEKCDNLEELKGLKLTANLAAHLPRLYKQDLSDLKELLKQLKSAPDEQKQAIVAQINTLIERVKQEYSDRFPDIPPLGIPEINSHIDCDLILEGIEILLPHRGDWYEADAAEIAVKNVYDSIKMDAAIQTFFSRARNEIVKSGIFASIEKDEKALKAVNDALTLDGTSSFKKQWGKLFNIVHTDKTYNSADGTYKYRREDGSGIDTKELFQNIQKEYDILKAKFGEEINSQIVSPPDAQTSTL